MSFLEILPGQDLTPGILGTGTWLVLQSDFLDAGYAIAEETSCMWDLGNLKQNAVDSPHTKGGGVF